MKKTLAAATVAAGLATGAFADAHTENPLAVWRPSADEMAEMLNTLPPELAMQLYNIRGDIEQCLNAGNAFDVGKTYMNQLKYFVDFLDWTSENHVNGWSANAQIDFSNIVECVSQAEAQVAKCEGADVIYYPNSKQIMSFSGHLETPWSLEGSTRLECIIP